MVAKVSKSKSKSKAKEPKRAKEKSSGKLARIKKARIKEKVLLDIPLYAQTEDFTSSAAAAMMVLKTLNKNFKLKKDVEEKIWQEAVNGSVWYGSKYGLAYALAKRGAEVAVMSNTKDEGYEKTMAVYENINLDTLSASFSEIKQKALGMGVEEEYIPSANLQLIKKALSSNYIPIILIDIRAILGTEKSEEMESLPHWVVVKGYDKDNFYINDPYSYHTIALDPESLKAALGYENDFHMILVKKK
ncbi:MAG: peptidase C39 family protein [Candidatus Micrarchaeia archaeon]